MTTATNALVLTPGQAWPDPAWPDPAWPDQDRQSRPDLRSRLSGLLRAAIDLLRKSAARPRAIEMRRWMIEWAVHDRQLVIDRQNRSARTGEARDCNDMVRQNRSQDVDSTSSGVATMVPQKLCARCACRKGPIHMDTPVVGMHDVDTMSP